MIYSFGKRNGGGGEYVLPKATENTLGGVKIGDGITIDSDGKISAQGGGSLLLKGEIELYPNLLSFSPNKEGEGEEEKWQHIYNQYGVNDVKILVRIRDFREEFKDYEEIQGVVLTPVAPNNGHLKYCLQGVTKLHDKVVKIWVDSTANQPDFQYGGEVTLIELDGQGGGSTTTEELSAITYFPEEISDGSVIAFKGEDPVEYGIYQAQGRKTIEEETDVIIWEHPDQSRTSRQEKATFNFEAAMAIYEEKQIADIEWFGEHIYLSFAPTEDGTVLRATSTDGIGVYEEYSLNEYYGSSFPAITWDYERYNHVIVTIIDDVLRLIFNMDTAIERLTNVSVNVTSEGINWVKAGLPVATADTLGGVKIGNGITIDSDGKISAQGGSLLLKGNLELYSDGMRFMPNWEEEGEEEKWQHVYTEFGVNNVKIITRLRDFREGFSDYDEMNGVILTPVAPNNGQPIYCLQGVTKLHDKTVMIFVTSNLNQRDFRYTGTVTLTELDGQGGGDAPETAVLYVNPDLSAAWYEGDKGGGDEKVWRGTISLGNIQVKINGGNAGAFGSVRCMTNVVADYNVYGLVVDAWIDGSLKTIAMEWNGSGFENLRFL